MATASGKSTSKSKTTTSKNTNKNVSKGTKRSVSGNTKKKKPTRKNVDIAVKNEAMLIVILAAAIFVFLCVIGLIHGTAAEGIQSIMFGLFGFLAYVIPIITFFGFAFGISNRGNTVATIKLISFIVLVCLLGIISYMIMGQEKLLYGDSLVKELYITSIDYHAGGGVLFGIIGHALYKLIGFAGTLFIVLVLGIISIVFITEKSFLRGIKKGGTYLIETAREDAARLKEYRESLIYEYEDDYLEKEEKPRTIKASRNTTTREPKEKVRRMDKKARGVVSSSIVTLKNEEKPSNIRNDMHEIVFDNEEESKEAVFEEIVSKPCEDLGQKPKKTDFLADLETENLYYEEDVNLIVEDENMDIVEENSDFDVSAIESMPEPMTEQTVKKKASVSKLTNDDKKEIANEEHKIQEQLEKSENEEIQKKKYIFPPINLLKKGEAAKGDSAIQLKETALKLQQTLQTFGVKVTITDISQGPSVTRYEMQPEQGVKVSKIVGLTDDIKLNLAATDIRIEAPIPGKAAVGIEVPNKENSAVALRDLLESQEFKNFPSNLAFAAGKDISGQVVVTDIAKMPHVLIAGATGSGKSVCINTIIMSILYKADPADVKLIMIDPKVVELSVYNGIPHLMIPVVTDPKKASAALHWGVAEMTERYKKFADLNVRDLKGYNKAVEMGKVSSEGEPLQKLPQIVIIVDELADLMMVAAGEVEESICRLAQLARACGIHLVIATQRPSVDVITGLIKANMPSRIAFSVSSGVDSRTILDMNGAEKLLGKGDMLFYPQGYTKPARVQGAFVSDSEVSDVVEFLKNQMLENTYSNDIEEKINIMQSSGGSASGMGGAAGRGNEVDGYFVEAGKFVIEKEKASIGMLQRVFKIGFNRAARIVDQLEEAGVVGSEEGTKPRRILMTMEQFENYVQENV